MAATLPITDSVVETAIVKAVQNVCRTLVRHEAKFVGQVSAEFMEIAQPQAQVIGNVGFVGQINGLVHLCMSHDCALFAVGSILGMSRAEVEANAHELVSDAIGEVTNMTAGGFKNALCDVGFPCKLTLPTIVRGNGLTISSLRGTARQAFRFECGQHELIADIQFKVD